MVQQVTIAADDRVGIRVKRKCWQVVVVGIAEERWGRDRVGVHESNPLESDQHRVTIFRRQPLPKVGALESASDLIE